MPTTVDIGIFNIGRTQVDREEVQRWLDFLGVQQFTLPEDEAVSNPALLIALACKRCFDDQTEILTDSGWKRFEQLDRTERVLTYNPVSGASEWQLPHGHFADEHDGPMVSVEGRDLSMLVTPDHRVYGWAHRGIDRAPRFISGQELLNASRFCVPLALGRWHGEMPAEIVLPTYSYQYALSNQTGQSYGVATRRLTRRFAGVQVPAFARLLAYYVTEGTADRVGDDVRYLAIYGDHYDEVSALCRVLGLKCSYTTDRRNGCRKIRVGGGRQLARYVVALCGKGAQEKHLPRWVLDLPPDELRKVWDILVAADGTVTAGGQELFQSTSRQLVGQAQEILVKIGAAAGMSLSPLRARPEAEIQSRLPSSYARRKNRRFAVVNGPNTAAQACEVPYRGRVYCVSTRNGVVCVRRSGKVFWSGNCYKSFEPGLNPNVSRVRADYGEYLDNVLKSGHGSALEHSVYNFAIENVSRVFTSEMNRHRAGWAISEGSLRFIRFGDNIPYWEPDSIKGPEGAFKMFDQDADKAAVELLNLAERGRVDDVRSYLGEMLQPADNASGDILDAKKELTRVVFKRAFGHQETCYRVLEAVWAAELAPDSKFQGKKEITSLMRRIVGLGVATGGVWSGNVRALRHVITMRCEPAAEEEILHVFSRVCRLMAQKEPLMFGDFQQDGLGYWRPVYRKV